MKKVSPSRQRRQDRRAAARKESAANVDIAKDVSAKETNKDVSGKEAELVEGVESKDDAAKDASGKEAEPVDNVQTKVGEISTVLEAKFIVVDEICDDDAFGTSASQAAKNDNAEENLDLSDLREVGGKHEIVEPNSGEVLIEVRPQLGKYQLYWKQNLLLLMKFVMMMLLEPALVKQLRMIMIMLKKTLILVIYVKLGQNMKLWNLILGKF